MPIKQFNQNSVFAHNQIETDIDRLMASYFKFSFCYLLRSTSILAVLVACISFNIIYSLPAHAQLASDIYVGKLSFSSEKSLQNVSISELERITDTETYTNQPYFFSDTHLYFTQADLADDPSSESTEQTDIFLYQFPVKSTNDSIPSYINISNSKESEYSPTPLPQNKGMSVIRVNREGKQELWALNSEGGPLKHLAQTIEPVGYQVWLNNDELLLFVLGEPHTLQRVSASNAKQVQVIDENIGASLFRFKNSEWFLYSKGSETLTLMAYNSVTRDTHKLISMPQGSQYFSVTPRGEVITSNGKALFYIPLKEREGAASTSLHAEDTWRFINVESYIEPNMKNGKCKSGISRTAVSPSGKKIALVCPH